MLRADYQLTIVEPTRQPPDNGAARRAFPFEDVEFAETTFTKLQRGGFQKVEISPGSYRDTFFQPTAPSGRPLRLPVVLHAPRGAVRIDVPVLFVKDFSPEFDTFTNSKVAAALSKHYDRVRVAITPTTLDLVQATGPAEDGDLQQVRALVIGGGTTGGDARPSLEEMEISLPALSTVLGKEAEYHRYSYTDDFRHDGIAANVFLKLVAEQGIPIDFAGKAERSGALLAPKYAVNAISRQLGPVKAVVDGATSLVATPAALFDDDDATLLGYPLKRVLGDVHTPPVFSTRQEPGQGRVVTMSWNDVSFNRDAKGFVAGENTRLDLRIAASGTGTKTICSLHDFSLALPTTKPLVKLSFRKITFVRLAGVAPPEIRDAGDDNNLPAGLTMDGLGATLEGGLKLFEELGKHVSVGRSKPQIEPSTTGVAVAYSVPLPAVSAGVFVMRNILFRAGLNVSFTGAMPELELGFATRESPFVLTVMAFGGGGYLEVTANQQGLRRLEAALEFGALVAVDFVIARGEAHVLGGVRFVWDAARSELEVSGYLRIGGTLDVLGLVSVAVELRLELTYQSSTKALVGRATVILEIDILFLSETVEVDSGEWRLLGGSAPVRQPAFQAAFQNGSPNAVDGTYTEAAWFEGSDPGLEAWSAYRRRFEPEPQEA